MELYIKVSFWLYVLSVIIRMIYLSFADYPRKNTPTSRLADVISLAILVGFTFWAAKLLGWA